MTKYPNVYEEYLSVFVRFLMVFISNLSASSCSFLFFSAALALLCSAEILSTAFFGRGSPDGPGAGGAGAGAGGAGAGAGAGGAGAGAGGAGTGVPG